MRRSRVERLVLRGVQLLGISKSDNTYLRKLLIHRSQSHYDHLVQPAFRRHGGFRAILKHLAQVTGRCQHGPHRPQYEHPFHTWGFVTIDFDACLFLRRAALPYAFAPAGSSVARFELELPAPTLPTEVLVNAVDQTPAEWIEAAGPSRKAFASDLVARSAAWSALAAA